MTLNEAKAQLLRLLTRLSYEQREVTLSSGKKSSFYIDCKQTMLTAEGHYLIGFALHELIGELEPTVRAVGGLTMGADPIASAIATVSYAQKRPLDAFYIRKEPKEHGTQKWIEGDKVVVPGTPVVIVEDVCTTGASALRAVERARLHGLEIKRVISLVDRDEGGRAEIEKHVPFTALFRRSDFPA
jgi:orotate phosphoribosyltransferase